MSEGPYRRFDPQRLILRDHLAIDRTILANERTLLAYVRTALGFLVLGLTFLHFFPHRVAQGAAYVFLAIGALVAVIGAWRFVRLQRALAAIRRGPIAEPSAENDDAD